MLLSKLMNQVEVEDPGLVEMLLLPPPHKLHSTPKPTSKSMGKLAKKKLHIYIYMRFLDYLETSDNPVELQFSSMPARVKLELPLAEQSDVAHKLTGHLNE